MSERAVRLAIIGAGAVSEKRYLPAAGAVSGLEITHLVDLDGARARMLATEYGVPHAAEDYREILGEVDGAVIATPPATHRSIAVTCLDSGVHVLCEKPLASASEEGEAMVDAARASDAMLSVAMVRRCGRSARLLHRCVRLGLPGRIQRVVMEEGGAFNWPLRTSHIFDPSQGGVLRDTGSHLLDLMFWVVEAREARVSDYRDDSWGGPEANARVDLELETPSGLIDGRVQVSFTRSLENRIRIHGSEGVLEAPSLGGAEVVFAPADGTDPVRLIPGDGEPRARVEDFSLQLREFVASIGTSGPPPVPPESPLLGLHVIDECYGMRTQSLHPWEVEPGADEGGPEERDSRTIDSRGSHV